MFIGSFLSVSVCDLGIVYPIAADLYRGQLRGMCARLSPTAGDIPRCGAGLSPTAPFLSAAKEMGERTPPKTDGFWISFRRWPARSNPSEMWNRRISLCAAAFALKRAGVCSFRVLRLGEPHRHLPPIAASARFDNRQNGRPAYAHILQVQRQRG